MNKYHIPTDLINKDGENELHAKVNKDAKFSEYLQVMLQLLDEHVKDEKLKRLIFEACQLVYIFAEIAAYMEGFNEGIRFLTNSLVGIDDSKNLGKRGNDFCVEFNKFIEEYKLDRIADVHNSLGENETYNKLNDDKAKYEKEILELALDSRVIDILMNYLTSVDHLVDEIKSIFYEHGFQDSVSIKNALSNINTKNLN